MAEGMDVFKARISATDDTSAVMKLIMANAKLLGHELEQVGHKQAHLENPGVWARMREHTQEAGKQFGELGEHVKGVHERISELIPALGALGAAGSLAALVENTEHMAEAYGEMAHTAESLGISTQAMSQWNIVAKLSDTSAESMDKSMSKLNRTLADAGSGKNKDAASLLKQLHLDPRSFKDSAAALPALADAFQHTHSATMRTKMAMALFGKAGADMIPLLMRGRDGIAELQAEAAKLGPNFTEIGPKLEAYNESMKKMSIATDAFRYVVAGELAPVFQPVVDGITEWTVANREWIATGIKQEISEVSGWVKSVDWKGVGSEIHVWASTAEDFVQAIGGAKTVVELLAGAMVLKGGVFLFKETAQAVLLTAKLGAQIVQLGLVAAGWLGVGAAATEAGAAEAAASAVGGGVGAVSKLGTIGKAAAGIASIVALPIAGGVATKVALDTLDPHQSGDAWADRHVPGYSWVDRKLNNLAGVSDAQWRKDRGFDPPAPVDGDAAMDQPDQAIQSGRAPAPGFPITPAPTTGGAQHAAAAPNGHVGITVTINGAPPGTGTSVQTSGNVAAPKVNVGQAFHDVN
jgi:hypothetical protein